MQRHIAMHIKTVIKILEYSDTLKLSDRLGITVQMVTARPTRLLLLQLVQEISNYCVSNFCSIKNCDISDRLSS